MTRCSHPPTQFPAVTSTRFEERQVGDSDKTTTTVLLDSVASQANRAEFALLSGWESGELKFPVPFVDFTVDEDVADLNRLTVLEAPHRIADAIFRDSLLGGTLFRLAEIGQAITDATPRNATALFHYSPTALLFGMWDSTGPKGGLGSKFQRAYVSEIVGLNAELGAKVGSRIDPAQIENSARRIKPITIKIPTRSGPSMRLKPSEAKANWSSLPAEAKAGKPANHRRSTTGTSLPASTAPPGE